MYDWIHGHFKVAKDGGTIVSNKPAPLSEQQMRTVWDLLEQLDDYRNFKFIAVTQDDKVITNKEES
jgi:hypothetical protein